MLADVVRLEGGDPLMGRHLKTVLVNAGFVDVRVGYGADLYENEWERDDLQDLLRTWGLSEEYRLLTGHSREEFARWNQQVLRWSEHPGALGCFHFGHAVMRR